MSGSCFFIGHREADGRIWSSLVDAVNRHITEYGVTDFTVGRYGGFDALASKAVLSAKEEYPEVRLTLLLPYHPFDRPFKLPEGFDGSFYPPGMSAGHGDGAAPGSHRPRKPIYGGSLRSLDCLRMASGQQCEGPAGLCQGKGKARAHSRHHYSSRRRR